MLFYVDSLLVVANRVDTHCGYSSGVVKLDYACGAPIVAVFVACCSSSRHCASKSLTIQIVEIETEEL